MKAKSLPHLVGGLVCLLWCAVLLYYYGAGLLPRYLNEQVRVWGLPLFNTLCLLTGGGLGVAGLFLLLTLGEKDADCCGHDHGEKAHACCGHDHHHEHEKNDPGHNHETSPPIFLLTVALMTVPVAFAALNSPHRFSVNYLMRKDGRAASTPAIREAKKSAAKPKKDAFTLKDLEAQVPRNENGDFPLSVSVLAMNAGDEEIREVLTGEPVESVGQVMPESPNSELPANRFRLFQLNIFCCAADARPVTVFVETKTVGQRPKELTWLKVRGVVKFEKIGEYEYRAVLEASSRQPAKPPDDAYTY